MALIRMFVSCASPSGEILKPSGLLEHHALTWKEVLLAHAKHGKADQVLKAYQQMNQSSVKPDGYVFVSVIKACASKGAFMQGKLIHAQVIDSGFEPHVFVGSALISMYVNCGSLEDGQRVFDGLSRHDIVTWNAMIAGYAHYGHVEKTLELFQRMHKGEMKPNIVTWNAVIAGYAQLELGQEALQVFNQMQQEGWMPDDVTYASILNACTRIEAQEQGKMIHVYVVGNGLDSNVFVGNTLINLYVKCGNFKHAHAVFKRLPKQDCVTWNVLIAGYALHGHSQEALELFHDMQKKGQSPDLVTWNAMLTGHVQHGRGQQALILFQQMQAQGRKPDTVTFVNALKACSIMSAIDKGKLIHSYVIDTDLSSDLFVSNALIDMYAKCGSLGDASRVFEVLPKRDLVTWNSIIAAYAMHNCYSMVFECFKNMQLEGFQPDEVTFLCILAACARGGFVEKGRSHFVSMREHYGIPPKPEHYNCMVDLLGREGFLKEAETLLGMAPLKGNVQGWTSLLSHCRTYGDVKLGRQCFDQVFSMDDQYTSIYELMSALYADMAMWEDVGQVQELQRCVVSAQKPPGESFVELKNQVPSRK